MRHWQILGVAVCLLAAPTPVSAQPRCPTIEGGDEALAERPVEERAAFVLAASRQAFAESETWTTIYAVGYLGLAAGQLALGVALNDEDRLIDYQIGAASSMIGVASLFILPAAILREQPAVETLAPAAAAGDCEALAEAERVLLRGAASEDFGTSWLMHVGGVLFNLAVGLYMGLFYGHWESGAISAGVGIAIGELQILTRPTPLGDALARYRAGTF
ncbi:MAG: hypothetical protein RLO52_14305 [Sandaracinaceae bacterium]